MAYFKTEFVTLSGLSENKGGGYEIKILFLK